MTKTISTQQVEVTEATSTFTPTEVDGKPGRLLIGIIDPGQGSSGYYSQECLEAAAADKVFSAGTLMFADHPTEQEQYERPVRSIKDVVAVLSEDAYWDADAGKLVAEAELFPQYRDAVTAMKDHIGVSIRAAADVSEGKNGREITRIVHAESVDFVTKAGRGGSILQVLESAAPRVNARAIRRGVNEATVNDRREALHNILRDAYAADRTYVWLRDFDDTTAWFDIESGEDSGTFQQMYTSTDDVPTGLAGDRVEVRTKTTYVPVATESSQSDPAGQQHPINESTGGHMATIEEAELAKLREDSSRVAALEAERDEHKNRADAAERAKAVLEAGKDAEKRARARVAEANKDLAPIVVDKIVAEATREVPLTDAGQLDEAAFDTRVDEARTAEEGYLATLAEAAGAGRVTAFGGTTPVQVDESTLRESNDKQRPGIFGRTIKEA